MNVYKMIPLLFVVALTFGQTAEEIMDKSADAMGGSAAKEVTTMVMAGSMTMMGTIKGDLLIYSKEGGKVYTQTTINAPGMKMEVVQGCDGTDCYSVDPNFGKRLLEGQEKEMMMLNNDFQAMTDWRKTYTKYEYKGEGEFNGKKTHKVYLESDAGMKLTQEIDAETWLPVRGEGNMVSPMGAMDFVLLYRDYKDVHNGMLLPMTLEHKIMNQSMVMTIDEVEVNVKIPDSKFALPEGLK